MRDVSETILLVEDDRAIADLEEEAAYLCEAGFGLSLF